MGYIRHNAIVVTSWNSEAIEAAADRAKAIGLGVLGPNASHEVVNNNRTMLVVPDGSKEGWGNSDIGDKQRAEFREYLDSQRYEDGSTCLHWVEIAYGSDDQDATIEAHAWQNMPDVDEGPEGGALPVDA